jgi:hypothetical protein
MTKLAKEIVTQSLLVVVAHDEALVPIERACWLTLAPIGGDKEFRRGFT